MMVRKDVNMEIQDIKALIELDEATRKDIEEAHRVKNELKKSVADAKQKISDETWKAVKEQVELTKVEIDTKVKQASLDNKETFENSSSQLRTIFEKNHKQWCQKIVERCLK